MRGVRTAASSVMDRKSSSRCGNASIGDRVWRSLSVRNPQSLRAGGRTDGRRPTRPSPLTSATLGPFFSRENVGEFQHVTRGEE